MIHALARSSPNASASASDRKVFEKDINISIFFLRSDESAEWANESLALTREYIYPFPVADINEEYAVRALPLLQQRLAQPGSVSFGCDGNPELREMFCVAILSPGILDRDGRNFKPLRAKG